MFYVYVLHSERDLGLYIRYSTDYAPVVRYVALPVIVLSGLWMWKGHLVRRLISKTR